MRPTQLLTSLYLAQAALAAPILLVAGSSARAVFIKPARQMYVTETTQIILEDQHEGAGPSKTVKTTAAALLDADGPLSTEDLMALSRISAATLAEERLEEAATQSTKPMTTTTTSSSDSKGKITVGTLVVPGPTSASAAMSQWFDPKSPRPYLIPGYYVSSQQADFLVVGIIMAFVLVVVAVETCGPITRTYVHPLKQHAIYKENSWHANLLWHRSVARILQRQGSIRLEADKDTKAALAPVQPMSYDSDDDEDDDDDVAPFGGSSRRSSLSRGCERSSKVAEKAGWI